MASIKTKYRPSTVKGKDGALFFQIIHLRQIKHINTGLHISESEWSADDAAVIKGTDESPERAKYLSVVKDSLKGCQKKLLAVITALDNKGNA